jgi:hypothetical protein
MSRCCLDLNNAGVDLLRCGDVNASMRTLVKALGAAKGMLKLLGESANSATYTLRRKSTKQRPTVIIDTTKFLAGGQSRVTQDANNKEGDQQNIYLRAFFLTESWFVSMDYKEMLTVSVAVVFNLALAHHVRALACSHLCEHDERLLQALDLYELAHSMQQEGETLFSMELSCAIACNLGNIHRMRGDEERTKQCFQHLHMLLVFVQQTCDKSEKLSAAATDAFSRCICTLLNQSTTAPAA